MWLPLVVLAIMSIIGGAFLNVREFLDASIKEANQYCVAEMKKADPNAATFDVFTKQWPSVAPRVPTAEDGTAAAALTHSQHLHEKGEHLMHTTVGWAWLIGIGLGVLVYLNGYKVANALMYIAPLRWINIWLKNRMYFDELYFKIFVALTMGLSKLSAWFDKYIVDGIVNLVGWLTRQGSAAIGMHDKYVVDGAVNGVAALSQELGAAVRAPQTGRIRMYVTVLMAAVTLGLAGAIIVVLSR